MPDLPGNIGGFNAWGGNPPTHAPSADGSVFWGRNEKSAAGFFYAVYRVPPNAAPVLVWRSEATTAGTGQGVLTAQPNGQLILSYYVQTGDGQPARPIVIPGYVPWPAAQGPRGPQGPPGPQGLTGKDGPPGPPGADLSEEFGVLSARFTDLEGTLGTPISKGDREVLRRMKVFLGIEEE